VSIDESGNVHANGLSNNIPKTIVKEEFKPIDLKLVMKYKLDWYMSAISCRASLLKGNSSFIKKTKASLDKLTFLLSIETGGSLYFDSRFLTKYRIHESLTNRLTDMGGFLTSRKDFYLRSLKSLKEASRFFKKNITLNLINWEIIHGKLLVYFFSDDNVDLITIFSLIKQGLLSFFKGLSVITYWSLLDVLRKIMPKRIRSSFYKRSIRKVNVFFS
jgi:hypothetical protein